MFKYFNILMFVLWPSMIKNIIVCLFLLYVFRIDIYTLYVFTIDTQDLDIQTII